MQAGAEGVTHIHEGKRRDAEVVGYESCPCAGCDANADRGSIRSNRATEAYRIITRTSNQ
jgi:hypothetical protein